MKITKKTQDRIKANLPKFQKILADAKLRKINESNTVDIITDILAEVFGYEKYSEITREFAVRGTYCDLAIKLDNDRRGSKVEYLIECKSIDTELKEAHLRQAIGYGANEGIEWLILTNGIEWQIHRLRFGQPINCDLVARFDLLKSSPKDERDIEKLFIVTKEGVDKNAREELCEKARCVNRFVFAQLLISDLVVSTLRKEIRKIGDGINVEDAEIATILRNGVLRGDLFDCEEAKAAASIVSRHFRQLSKKPSDRERAQPTNHEIPNLSEIPTGSELHLSSNGVTARCRRTADGFMVFAGQAIVPAITPSAVGTSIEKTRSQLMSDGVIVDGKFARDHVFSTASGVASCILGSPVNGNAVWKPV